LLYTSPNIGGISISWAELMNLYVYEYEELYEAVMEFREAEKGNTPPGGNGGEREVLESWGD